MIERFLLQVRQWFLSTLGALLFGFPGLSIPLLVVTGKKGKTSFIQLYLEQMVARKKSVAVITSKGAEIYVQGVKQSGYTHKLYQELSPLFLQKFLAMAKRAKVDRVLMEYHPFHNKIGTYRYCAFDEILTTYFSLRSVPSPSEEALYSEVEHSLFANFPLMKRKPGIEKSIIACRDDYFYNGVHEVVSDRFSSFGLTKKAVVSIQQITSDGDTGTAATVVIPNAHLPFRTNSTNTFVIRQFAGVFAICMMDGILSEAMTKDAAHKKALDSAIPGAEDLSALPTEDMPVVVADMAKKNEVLLFFDAQKIESAHVHTLLGVLQNSRCEICFLLPHGQLHYDPVAYHGLMAIVEHAPQCTLFTDKQSARVYGEYQKRQGKTLALYSV